MDTTMSRMGNLGDVLELVIDGFDDRSFAKQDLVHDRHQAILHVFSQAGNQLHILFKSWSNRA